MADWFEHGPYEKTLWNLHILIGYTLTAGLLTRLLWSLAGPASARRRDLWRNGADGRHRTGAGRQRVPDGPARRLAGQCGVAGGCAGRTARIRIRPDARLHRFASGCAGVSPMARRTGGAKHGDRQAIPRRGKRGAA